MKVRWNSQSIRFRITPGEMAALSRGEAVCERFGPNTGDGWQAELNSSAGVSALEVEGSSVKITLADADVVRLGRQDVEGVYFRSGDQPEIRYLVEKDYPCAHPRSAEAAEVETETFEPPDGFLDRKLQPDE